MLGGRGGRDHVVRLPGRILDDPDYSWRPQLLLEGQRDLV